MSIVRDVMRFLAALTLTCTASISLRASALPLGAATGYNVFLFSNFSESYTDSEGRMAVGGNFTSNGFTVASNKGSDAAGTYDLVVGGNYTNTYNRVAGGDIFVGGNMNWSGPTIPNNAYVNGNVTNSGYGSVNGTIYYGGTYSSTGTLANQKLAAPKTSPIDFLSARTELTSLSANLASQTATAAVLDNGYNTYTLTGTSAGINIFNLTKNSWSGSTINISAPAGSTVIVNVPGSSVGFNGGSVNITGTDTRNVIFNFGSATTLALGAIGFNGTILAPIADITGSYGNINGQVIANSFSGTTEFHDYLFTGTVPTPTDADVNATPEPSTWATICGGLALLGVVRLRRTARPDQRSLFILSK